MAAKQEKIKKFCPNCGRTRNIDDFYKSQNLEKYPDGHLNMCKDCATMFVDNWKSDTYLWILQEADVPYVPEEWDKLLAKYCQDPAKATGLSIIGRYLAKMRLGQWGRYRWADTNFLRDRTEKLIREQLEADNYSEQEITTLLDERSKSMRPLVTTTAESSQKDPVNDQAAYPVTPTVDVPRPIIKAPPPPKILADEGLVEIDTDEYQDDPTPPVKRGPGRPKGSKNKKTSEEQVKVEIDLGDEEDPDDTFDLTDDERRELRLRWGKVYRPDEWIWLEQLYRKMMDSYDVQGAGHEDTLKLACKTSLKSNQLLDIGDIDGAQKAVKMYDSLMKSGNFTAAQNKKEKGEAFDSISELVEMCEKKGYIERYYIDQPKDKVDITLKDMQRFTKSLIAGESNLGEMMDAALKANAKEDEDAAKNNETEIIDDDSLFDDIEAEITDHDFSDFYDYEEEEKEGELDGAERFIELDEL